MKDPEGLFAEGPKQSPYALKASTVDDLPSERVLAAYVKEAVKLNAAGVKPVRGASNPARKTPADLVAALRKNKKASATFNGFPPSHKREYIERRGSRIWARLALGDAARRWAPSPRERRSSVAHPRAFVETPLASSSRPRIEP